MNIAIFNYDDFFNRIYEHSISQLEVHNTLQMITNNFELEKLRILKSDFNHFHDSLFEIENFKYINDDVSFDIEERIKEGVEIPYIYLYKSLKDKKEGNSFAKVVDFEKLFFPEKFAGCKYFSNLIDKYIRGENSNFLDNSVNISKYDKAYNTRIFKNSKGLRMFDKYIEHCPKTNDDFGYIYRKLIAEGFMFRVTHSEYREFCSGEPYCFDSLDKIKTLLELENLNRIALYSSVLESLS
jgi:hypothetical protein